MHRDSIERTPMDGPIVADEHLGKPQHYRAQLLSNAAWRKLYHGRFGQDESDEGLKGYVDNAIELLREIGYEPYYYRPYASGKLNSIVTVGIDPDDPMEFFELDTNESTARFDFVTSMLDSIDFGRHIDVELKVAGTQARLESPVVLVIENDDELPDNVSRALGKHFAGVATNVVTGASRRPELEMLEAMLGASSVVTSPTYDEGAQLGYFISVAYDMATRGKLSVQDVYIVAPGSFDVPKSAVDMFHALQSVVSFHIIEQDRVVDVHTQEEIDAILK